MRVLCGPKLAAATQKWTSDLNGCARGSPAHFDLFSVNARNVTTAGKRSGN
jgi:hypothetical protein